MEKEGIERMQVGRSQYHGHVVQSELILPPILSSLTKQPPEDDNRQHLAQGHSHQHEQSRDRNQQQPMVTTENRGSDLPELVSASPISSRPPGINIADSSFNQALVPVAGNVLADDADALGGDESERGYSGGGSRWPRQETLALLKIRSEMDPLFQNTAIKSPLWEHVSRRLADLGYHRSAKKCKEKFENVYKYYKRTKGRRSGGPDGKSYRFFSQLEALYGNNNKSNCIATDANNHGKHIHSNTNRTVANGEGSGALEAAAAGPQREGTTSSILSMQITPPTTDFSIFSSSESSEDEDDCSNEDDPDHDDGDDIRGKRKRASSQKMMIFFEKLMKKVLEKQELMQQRFLEAIEKREHERSIREEAWKRQEMARLNRENEIRARERALSAARDTALVAFLQKVTGQTLQLPQLPVTTPQQPNAQETVHRRAEDQFEEGSFDPNSKRWPKPEVLALIKLRSGFELRFHDAGPKAQLWEQISARMADLGYHRTPKRCKEKWENINKYFKKAKESNKERPENANTCPYFHQLDALYRKGILGNSPNAKLQIKEPDEDDDQEEQTCGSIRDDHSPPGGGNLPIKRPSPPPDPRKSAAAVPPDPPASDDQLDACTHSHQEQPSQEADVTAGERAMKKVKMKQHSDDAIISGPPHEVSGTMPENVGGSELFCSGNSSSKSVKVPDSDVVMMDVQSRLTQTIANDEYNNSTQVRDQNLQPRENHGRREDLDLPYVSHVYDSTVNNVSSADPRDPASASSFIAMVHNLAAEHPRFNMSGPSNGK